MKKGTGGYVLIYVLVVFILLGLACAAVCTFALNGLKTQRNALRQDQQRYAAEGVVEQVVARLLDSSGSGPIDWSSTESSLDDVWFGLESRYSDLIQAMEETGSAPVPGLVVLQEKDNMPQPTDRWTESEETPGEYTGSFETKLQTVQDGQQLSTTLRMTLTVQLTNREVEEEGNPDPETGLPTTITTTVYDYQVTAADLSYADYQIQEAEPEGGGEP